MISRRKLLAVSPSAFCLYALAAEAAPAVPQDRRLPAWRWIRRQDELARGLETGAMSQRQWHDQVNALAAEIDVGDLASLIRRAELAPAGAPDGHDPVKRFVRFRDEAGRPARQAYGLALFSFDNGEVITPHGHKHMVSAHMVLDGKVRIRTFDRLGETGDALVLRPAIDEIAEPGQAAAMSSAKDNIHWFAPRTATAMTLDVIIDGLDTGQERYTIQPVDVLGAGVQADGTLRAPLMSFEASSSKYGSSL